MILIRFLNFLWIDDVITVVDSFAAIVTLSSQPTVKIKIDEKNLNKIYGATKAIFHRILLPSMFLENLQRLKKEEGL